MKSKILLLLVTVVLLTTTASAGTESLLVSGQRLIQDTETSNRFVTWSDTAYNGLNIYDLNTKQMVDCSTFINNQPEGVAGNIELYNDYIVWTDMSGRNMLYDATTNTVTQIDTGGDTLFVNANKVVYEKNDDICVYNITKKSKSKFSSHGMNIGDLSENKVVGTMYDNSGNSNVYIADIGTQKMSAISTSGQAYDPQINGNIVTWAESNNGQNDVYMRDINAHKTSKVSSDKHSSNPKVYGNRIVYTSSYTSNGALVSNIYMYDKSTGKTTQITKSGMAINPSICGDNIVYEDFKNGDTTYFEEGDLYLYNLTTAPVAAFTASKTYSSTHPVTITFTYTGTGTTPITCKWKFGDGKSASTTSKSTTHTYAGAGVYTVGLTAANSAGNNYLSKSRFITVK
jgi:beta propeller repeat protein